jgi:hypothetical protein
MATLANNLNAPSPPNAFLAGIGAQGQTVSLAKNFLTTPPTASARFEFDLNVQRTTINNGLSSVFLAAIELPDRNSGAVSIFLSQSGEIVSAVSEAADGGPLPTLQGTGVKPAIGAWAGRIRIEATFGSNPHVQIYLNGNAVGNATTIPSSIRTPPGVRFELGIATVGSVGASAIAFDNVVADFH